MGRICGNHYRDKMFTKEMSERVKNICNKDDNSVIIIHGKKFKCFQVFKGLGRNVTVKNSNW
jgi:hypothetical protein